MICEFPKEKKGDRGTGSRKSYWDYVCFISMIFDINFSKLRKVFMT